MRVKNPLIQCMEDYFYSRNLKRKDEAVLLVVNESVFMQFLNGKINITVAEANKLYTDLNIDANLIIQNL